MKDIINLKPNITLKNYDNTIVIYGVAEGEVTDPKERFNKMKVEIENIFNQLNSDFLNSTVDVFRLGKYDKNKTRPICVKLNSIWTKRKMLSEYNKLKETNRRSTIFKIAD